jgi:AraC-like DNA-binding protein
VSERTSLILPRESLLELVHDAEDRVLTPIDPNSESLRHLRHYLPILFGPQGIGDDPDLTARVRRILLDLVALALGTGHDAAHLAHQRGLRAARTNAVLAAIREGFAQPAFSPHEVASRLGLSVRYIQDLMQQTGQSFSERVLELRLQKARNMLTDRHNDGRKVTDIALACGFNEVSYFHRCFRRRFGSSPTQYRGSRGN